MGKASISFIQRGSTFTSPTLHTRERMGGVRVQPTFFGKKAELQKKMYSRVKLGEKEEPRKE